MKKKKINTQKNTSKKNHTKKGKTKKIVAAKGDIKEEKIENSQNKEDLLALEKDKNLRLFAEFENFRKRTAKEKLDFFSTANKDIMTILLPILDNFERSIKANNYSEEDGPVLIYKQLKSELEKKGLKEMESPIGNELDTDFHEAITNIPAPQKEDQGKIIDVIEKGYKMGDKIIRFPKVVVGQ